MKLTEDFPVTPAKRAALEARIRRLSIDLSLVEESFTRGGGKGGQKINKTSNAVMLSYPPLGLVVKCQRERQRSLNRFIALRLLVDEIERRISPATSPDLAARGRVRKQKDRRRRRAATDLPPDSPAKIG